MTTANSKGMHEGIIMELDPGGKHIADYFGFLAREEYRLQRCNDCELLRFPPGPRCPWCTSPRYFWDPVEGTGIIYSYTEVAHASVPPPGTRVPYVVLLVELDEQNGRPTRADAIRVVGNLVGSKGDPASTEEQEMVVIGARVTMKFVRTQARFVIPQWQLDMGASVGGDSRQRRVERIST